MYKPVEKQAYTIEELAKMLGLTENRETDILWTQIKKGTFPFPVVKVRSRYFVSKKAVDDFLAGKTTSEVIKAWSNAKRGRPKKWVPNETVHYNYPIPIGLHEKFDKVCNGINKQLPTPLSKGDLIRLALEEFIDRRPEFLEGE